MFGKNLDVLLRGLVGSSESPGLSPTERILCVLLDIDVVLRVFEEYAFFFDMCQTWGTENDVLGRAGEQVWAQSVCKCGTRDRLQARGRPAPRAVPVPSLP